MRFVFGVSFAFGLHRNVRDFEVFCHRIVNPLYHGIVFIIIGQNSMENGIPRSASAPIPPTIANGIPV